MEVFGKPANSSGMPYLICPGGGSQYLVLKPQGGYDWIKGIHVAAELATNWPELRTQVEKDDGSFRDARLEELYRWYGHTLTELRYSWAPKGPPLRLDGAGGKILTIDCRRVAPIKAEYNEDCARWLELVGGAQHSRLLDWLSACARLDKPICALYLRGEPGFGKGMITEAVAQIFGGHIASYKKVVLGEFNDLLNKTPLVVLNEKAPERMDGSASFRDIVGGRSYTFSEKFKPAGTIEVCVRLLILANNDDALRLGNEEMNRDDEEAIGERICYIPVSRRVKQWLRTSGGESFTGDWVKEEGRPGKLVRHIQWLIENRAIVEPGIRMIVDGNWSTWRSLTHKRSGLSQDLLVAVAVAVAGDLSIPAAESPVHVDLSRGVLVMGKQLSVHWQRLTGKSQRCSYQRLGRELSKLSGEESEQVTLPNGMRRRGFWLQPDALFAAADDIGYDRLDELAEKLGIRISHKGLTDDGTVVDFPH